MGNHLKEWLTAGCWYITPINEELGSNNWKSSRILNKIQTENEINVSHKKNAISSLKLAKLIQFPSTSQVFLQTHLTRLWFSGPADGFTNLLIRLREKRRQLTMYFKRECQDFIYYIRITCSDVNNIFWRGFLAIKKLVLCSFLYIVSIMTDGRST